MNLSFEIIDESESHREAFCFHCLFLIVMKLDGIEAVVNIFLFTNAKILINTETWLLDQKNFERSEILGFYLYLRPAIQYFTVFAFTTPRHVNYRIGSCSEQSFAAQTGLGKA